MPHLGKLGFRCKRSSDGLHGFLGEGNAVGMDGTTVVHDGMDGKTGLRRASYKRLKAGKA